MESDFVGPVNIGSDEMVTINDLVKYVIDISGKEVYVKHVDGPTGVRGRNSDNTLIKEKLNWSPKQPLYDGLIKTYNWINKEIIK
jgi:nucleoside-diphosphate-sugar epimerase